MAHYIDDHGRCKIGFVKLYEFIKDTEFYFQGNTEIPKKYNATLNYYNAVTKCRRINCYIKYICYQMLQ